ncbi:MAG TPA: glycoside hydrolase family 3 N-terminal domain-containing protein [Bacteroidales bacterium]|nr:glycoside hydrolase family 3 N-terminal domain-containing protein [Bacteroidales bacterium]
MNIKSFPLILTMSILLIVPPCIYAQHKTIDQRVDSLLSLMTLEEKIGQMNQYSGFWEATGPITEQGNKLEQVRNGQLGSLLNITGYEHTHELQEMALQSRLKIPLLFGQDVIHGYRTQFPIPLAEAASWDLEAIELSARIAAIEAAAAGVHWTFAPMVDIGRDPRWGRVMEGAGEDPYLGSLIAAARVKGFQGKGYGNTDAVMACVKHFAAYGASESGRDYNSVDMSYRMLNEIYLRPYKAAVDAGAATVMNSFNDINGIPATANSYIQRDLLKGQWKFGGFVVSDWGSIGEMINHGYSKDCYQAAQQAITAGSDMDMESRCYIGSLAQLVKDGKADARLVDDAVRRILTKKFEMGLFDDPFKYSNKEREKQQWNNPDNLRASRDMAKKSIVLLKNEKQLLPLDTKKKTIAMIGPLVKAVRDNIGFWSYAWPDDTARIVTQFDGVKNRAGKNITLTYAKGCGISDSSKAGFAQAVKIAKQADIVILSIGEAGNMSGEAKSRSNIHLPGVQEDLVKAVCATGKPVIVLINAGRPLVFNWTADHAQAILYTWWLGTKAGEAIADVLFGDYNPSGKLPMTFPRSEGQIPIYYNHFSTGRPPKSETDVNYVSAYIDLPNSPKFPFGYGLSYTTFKYSEPVLNRSTINASEKLQVKVSITNTGNYDGKETVQLYIRDLVGSVVRPVKQLIGFQQVFLKKGETKEITFNIGVDDLKFYDNNVNLVAEPGDFEVFVGGSSATELKKTFTLL